MSAKAARRPWAGYGKPYWITRRFGYWVFAYLRYPGSSYEQLLNGWPLVEYYRMSKEKLKESVTESVEKYLLGAAASCKPEDPIDDTLLKMLPRLGPVLSHGMKDKAGDVKYARVILQYDKVAGQWSAELQVYSQEVKLRVVNDQFDGVLVRLDAAMGLERPPWQSMPPYEGNGKKRKK